MELGLDWLFARQRFGVKPGLTTTRALLKALGHPERAFESVLIGGTNGKGSTAATLAAILRAAGKREALFTSPHLSRFSERFAVAGSPVPDAGVAEALAMVRGPAERLGATFFEVVTALACLLFAEAGAELAVMEVGLGGRYDATNTLDPRLSVITGVSLDHTDILGATVEEIAAEKAGIMRPGRVCLTGANGAALAVLRDRAARAGAELRVLGEEFRASARSLGLQGILVGLRCPAADLELRSPLVGLHQARNVALAAAAGLLLGAGPGAVRRGVAATRWPGRLEAVPYEGRTILLDGAHNAEGARALAEALEDLGLEGCLLVFGVAADKDVTAMVRELEPAAREAILTRASRSPRAADPKDLVELWRIPAVAAGGPDEALRLALAKSAPGETVVVAGSLYLVGEVRPLLLREALEPYERLQ